MIIMASIGATDIQYLYSNVDKVYGQIELLH